MERKKRIKKISKSPPIKSGGLFLVDGRLQAESTFKSKAIEYRAKGIFHFAQ
jgi:hypothetical protein